MALFHFLMTLLLVIALILATHSLLYIRSVDACKRKQRRYGCLDPPKYPHRDPFGYDLYATRQLAARQGYPSAFDKSLFDAYGRTFEARRWGTWRQKMIWTTEPSNIQTIAALAFDHFEFRTLRRSFGPFLGNGVITTDGAEWAYSREMIRSTFRRSRISDFSVFEVHVKRFLDLLPQDGSTVDLQPMLKRLFADSSSEFFLGQSMDLQLSSKKRDAEEFLDAFDEAVRGMRRSVWLQQFGWLVQWNSDLIESHNKVYRVIDRYVDAAVRRANGELDVSGVQSRGDYVLIDEMVKNCKDKIRLRHEMLNVFLPARDAIGVVFGMIIYNLARNPLVWKKLRREVFAKLPPDTNISFDLLNSIQYMRYVVNESFRLRSTIHWSQRTCCKDCVLPAGGGTDGKAPILITKGQAVNINLYALHRDKKIWGEDAEEFRPERWEREPKMWEYLPFLGGARVCPGQQMVLAECSYLLVRVLQEFENLENRDPEPFVEGTRLLSSSLHGVKVGLIPTERQKASTGVFS